tara:strand:- start:1496 stop:2674 length:1179 start_codon:yes stop_codon:yes gene_type:complete
MEVALIAGTRPEIVKMAPVREALAAFPEIRTTWIATGQHADLAEQTLDVFGIVPDRKLSLQWKTASLPSLAARLVETLAESFAETRPDLVIVQGDTASAFAGATAAHLSQIPVGHVEAGLRSGDLANPFPEEGFRRMITPITDLNFAPTRLARAHLRAENVSTDRIFVTGNTVIDAVQAIADQDHAPAVLDEINPAHDIVLVTAHRRENWDGGIQSICEAVLDLRGRFSQAHFVLPAHPNPRVRETVAALLADEPRISLIEPLAYPEFIAVLKRATLVLSDSGGVQEEAPTFGVPVLVLRERTERMEAVKAGTAILVGTDRTRIVSEASRLLSDANARRRMTKGGSPFGDGNASVRIAKIARDFLYARDPGDTPGDLLSRIGIVGPATMLAE